MRLRALGPELFLDRLEGDKIAVIHTETGSGLLGFVPLFSRPNIGPPKGPAAALLLVVSDW